MSIKKIDIPSTLTVAACILLPALLLSACASAPKKPVPAKSTEARAEGNEPDLVAQLRARMASGSLQRQEKTKDRLPTKAAADTSQSLVIKVDIAKQQAAMGVEGDYAKALDLMDAEKDDEALLALQKIATKAPQFSGPLVNQAVILIKQKKFTEADKVLRHALQVNPQNPYAFNLKGQLLRTQGKFSEAKDAYESALAIDQNYAKAHFNYGVLADLYMQDLPLALSHYERYQSLQTKPDAAVANWIIDLQKRTGVYKAPVRAPVAAQTVEDTTEAEATANAPAAAETVPVAPSAAGEASTRPVAPAQAAKTIKK